MKTETLNQKLNSLKTANKMSVQLLEELFVKVSFKKGMILSMPDHSFPILYFIETGLTRGFFTHEQEEYTSWIMENGFILPSGFFTKKPAIEYTEFLTNASGWSLDLTEVEFLRQKDPLIYRLLLEIYEESLHAGKVRELMIRLKEADDRLNYAEKVYGNLIYKVVHNIIASFLNIQSKYLFVVKKKHNRK